jgi:hypothetical protein
MRRWLILVAWLGIFCLGMAASHGAVAATAPYAPEGSLHGSDGPGPDGGGGQDGDADDLSIYIQPMIPGVDIVPADEPAADGEARDRSGPAWLREDVWARWLKHWMSWKPF